MALARAITTTKTYNWSHLPRKLRGKSALLFSLCQTIHYFYYLGFTKKIIYMPIEPFSFLEVTVYPAGRDVFEIGANSIGILLALLLRRQRERQGMTLSEAAERLGQTSKNAYARYEQGRAMPSVEKLEQLLKAIAPDQKIVWRFAA